MTLLEIILGAWAVVATLLLILFRKEVLDYKDRVLERDFEEMKEDIVILKDGKMISFEEEAE